MASSSVNFLISTLFLKLQSKDTFILKKVPSLKLLKRLFTTEQPWALLLLKKQSFHF